MSWKPKVGDKGKTRNGKDYEVLLTDVKGLRNNDSVVARVDGSIQSYRENGLYCGDGSQKGLDLMVPKRTVYINVYPHTVMAYHDEGEARRRACGGAEFVAFPVELPE